MISQHTSHQNSTNAPVTEDVVMPHQLWSSQLHTLIELLFTTRFDACWILGIQSNQLYRYISGQGAPNFRVIVRLSLLGISIDWLITGKGKMTADNDAGRELAKYIQEGAKLSAKRPTMNDIVRYEPAKDSNVVLVRRVDALPAANPSSKTTLDLFGATA